MDVHAGRCSAVTCLKSDKILEFDSVMGDFGASGYNMREERSKKIIKKIWKKKGGIAK